MAQLISFGEYIDGMSPLAQNHFMTLMAELPPLQLAMDCATQDALSALTPEELAQVRAQFRQTSY